VYPGHPDARISVVICTLNEEENLPSVLPYLPRWVDEVIIVDGHSTDNTVEVARELRRDAKILYQPNKGKGEALKIGVKAASGDVVVTLDADGTYSPEEMPKFVQAVLQGKDVAKGSRFVHGAPSCMPLHRRLGNRVLAMTANLLLGTSYTDICSGYYAFRREVFQKLDLKSDGFEMEQEFFVKAAQMKLKVVEIQHSYYPRAHGASKTRDFRQGIRDILWILFLCLVPKRQRKLVGRMLERT